MEARKLVVQVAAICPFAMVLGMGATFRHTTSAHSTLQYSDAQNERIEAYAPLMTHSSWVSDRSLLAERYADMWISTARSGSLQALTPAFQEDIDEENPRSQILLTWEMLVQRLGSLMRTNLKAHNTSAAVGDATRIMGVAEILKYSDFYALRAASLDTVNALELIAPHVVDATPEAKAQMRRAIKASKENQGKLPEMYKLLRTNYEDYVLRRIGVGQQLGDESSKSVDSTSADDSDDGSSTQGLQRNYVKAISLGTKLKLWEAKVLRSAKS